jgi:hypothetical protein
MNDNNMINKIIEGVKLAYLAKTKMPRKLKKAIKKVKVVESKIMTSEKKEAFETILKATGRYGRKALLILFKGFHEVLDYMRKLANNVKTKDIE